MSQPTVAFALIVKGSDDEAPHLAKALASISGYVDAIYIDVNHPSDVEVSQKVVDIAKQYGDVEITEWTGNFVQARNNVFKRVDPRYDWVGWMDADDTIEEPRFIKTSIAIASKEQQGIYIKYDYEHDEFGNVTIAHWVARLVRNNGSYIWRSSIQDGNVSVHETLNEVIPRPKAMSEDFTVKHHSDPSRRAQSLERNIALLEGMYENQLEAGELDPRTLFYLATHYYDAQRYDRAKELLEQYMQLSGWAEERCEALVYLGNIYRFWGDDGAAKHAYLLAIGEYQNSPRPFIELSDLEFANQRYDDSIDWVEKSLKLPKKMTSVVQRPLENTYKAYMLAAQACVNLGGKRLDDAQTYISKALKLRPLDEEAQNARDIIEKLTKKRELIRAAVKLVNSYKEEGADNAAITRFIDSLPYDVQDNPLILTTRHHHAEPEKWPKKSIALYVGQGPLGIWGPWSLNDGIGGSEEAVIHMSRELTRLGYRVVVFATPGDRAGSDPVEIVGDDGFISTGEVEWRQYYEFNPKDEFDTLIAWRNAAFFDVEFKARKKYLWLHDMIDKEELTKERIANLTKVIFVSQWHADQYADVVPKTKRLASGNGIDPAAFVHSKGKRTPKRMVYTSAHNRGLKILLDNWERIKKEVPEAVLDLYYGWDSYDAINRDNPERMAWKDALVRQINSLDGVTDHGRINHQQVIDELTTADIFAYPCIFPEVYCISLIKAMAAGARPVTSDYAVMDGFNQYGIKVHYEPGKLHDFIEEYITTLIRELKRTENEENRDILKAHTRDTYSWLNTAKGWKNDIR